MDPIIIDRVSFKHDWLTATFFDQERRRFVGINPEEVCRIVQTMASREDMSMSVSVGPLPTELTIAVPVKVSVLVAKRLAPSFFDELATTCLPAPS